MGKLGRIRPPDTICRPLLTLEYQLDYPGAFDSSLHGRAYLQDQLVAATMSRQVAMSRSRHATALAT